MGDHEDDEERERPRDQLRAEVARLRADLDERESELARLREGDRHGGEPARPVPAVRWAMLGLGVVLFVGVVKVGILVLARVLGVR